MNPYEIKNPEKLALCVSQILFIVTTIPKQDPHHDRNMCLADEEYELAL